MVWSEVISRSDEGDVKGRWVVCDKEAGVGGVGLDRGGQGAEGGAVEKTKDITRRPFNPRGR